MMAGYAARGGIFRIIITDYQPVYRNQHFTGLNSFRPAGNRFRQMLSICQFTVNRGKAFPIKKGHSLAPGYDVLLQVNKRESIERQRAVTDLCNMFGIQSKCSGCKVARICVLFFILFQRIIDTLKIRIGNRRLSAHNQMTLIGKLQRKARDSFLHIGDVCTDGAVAAGKNLAQAPVIIGKDKRQAVKLPAEPDGAIPRPLLQVFHFLRFGKRKRRKFMRFLDTVRIIAFFRIADRLCGTVRKNQTCFLFECGQLIILCIPLVVGHQLFFSAVISL